jgi:hypothetical protein
MKTIIDPPSGWKYGFPKPYDEEKDGPIEEFLRTSGYPEKDIEFALKHMRAWSEE